MSRDEKHDAMRVLLRDYGYRFSGDILISNAIRGFASASIVGRFSGLFQACEHLIPIIRDDEFSSRFRSICAR